MRKLLFFILIALITFCGRTQNLVESTIEFQVIDFEMISEQLICLGDNNNLYKVDFDKNRMVLLARDVKDFDQFGFDHIAILKRDGSIFSFNLFSNENLLIEKSIDGYDFIEVLDGRFFLISGNSILNFAEKKIYPFGLASGLNDQMDIAYNTPLSDVVSDSKGNIWIGVDYGEWGGNLISFSTMDLKYNNLNFGELDVNLNPIEGLSVYENEVIVSVGQAHSNYVSVFSSTNLTLTKVISETFREIQINDKIVIKPPRQISAGSRDRNNYYFYSSDSIYSASADQDFENFIFDDWSLVHSLSNYTELYNDIEEFDGVFNIMKLDMKSISNDVFLTRHGDLGILNEKRLIIYKD